MRDAIAQENPTYNGPPGKAKQWNPDRTVTKKVNTDLQKFRSWCKDNGGDPNRMDETLSEGPEAVGISVMCVFTKETGYSQKWDARMDTPDEQVTMDSFGRIDAEPRGEYIHGEEFYHAPAEEVWIGPDDNLHSVLGDRGQTLRTL